MIPTICKDDKCPSCGSSDMRDATMKEEGTDYPVKICSNCGWWG